MNVVRPLVILFAVFGLGCTHALHQYHASETEYYKSVNSKKKVEATAEQTVVMGFAKDTLYVNEAFEELQRKCRGVVTGINTRYSTSHSFFSWTNKVHMQATCLK